jgi:hypothetical protein
MTDVQDLVARAIAATRWSDKPFDDLTDHSQDECKRFARAALSVLDSPTVKDQS